MTRASFARRLADAVAARGRLCVGLDPFVDELTAWDLPADVSGLERQTRTLVEALGESVAVFKPQSAAFEQFGSAGVAVLERVLADIAAAGALSLLDVKRGDIGSTMTGYARTHLAADAPVAADAITLSPYLGVGSLEPAFAMAEQEGRGVFVLARTSNPEGAAVQTARVETDTGPDRGSGSRTVAQSVADEVARRGPHGSFGLVVGATHDHGLDLAAFPGWVLTPGLGAQGAGPEDLARRFAGLGERLLPTTSRAIVRTGPRVSALQAAVIDWQQRLSDVC